MNKKRRQKLTINDFEQIAIIGRGAFGEVKLCRSKYGEIVAVKKMKKQVMLDKF
jgi:serine/threonine kinase 38